MNTYIRIVFSICSQDMDLGRNVGVGLIFEYLSHYYILYIMFFLKFQGIKVKRSIVAIPIYPYYGRSF